MSNLTKALFAAMILATAAATYEAHQERRARITAELSRDSVEAVADTTRLRTVRTLQRDVRVWERRAVQLTAVNDSLSEELGWRTIAHNRAVARVDDLETYVQGVIGREATEDGDVVQTADFRVRQEPYTAWARAVMTDPPILALRVALDPIPLALRLGCGVEDDLSRAYVGISAPEWADVRVVEARQEARMCNPDLGDAPSFWGEHGTKVAIGAGIVAGTWALKTLYDIVRDMVRGR